MADQQAWTIGAAPECDCVVDHPTVSGQHCRLTRAGEGFLIEDLDSTNGTFVNGTRITAPVGVTPDDDVKLGPETRFPWEMIVPQSANREIIRIGRDSDNDVVLDYANVSGNHARIVIEEGQATIEDLGSTNGISIGKPNNQVKSAPLKESDTVYFGSLAISAADLLNPGGTPVVLESGTDSPTAAGGASITPRTMAIAAAVLVVVAVAVGTVLKSFNGGDKPAEQPAADVAATDSGSDDSTTPPPARIETAVATKPDDAVYSVLVQQQGVDQLMQIGTAWAVSEHQLVTSAVVAQTLETLGKNTTAIEVRCASLDKIFVVTQHGAHPQFKKWEMTTATPKETYAAKKEELDDLQAASEPPSGEKIDAIAKKMVELKEELFVAGEKMAFFDVGLLTVEETLPFVLEIEEPARKLAMQAKASLVGVPYDVDAMIRVKPKSTESLEGRLVRIVPDAEDSDRPLKRLVVSAPADHHVDKNWSGSPVLNEAGRVIAVYARPTEPVDPQKPNTGESFDAVLVEQLQDLPITLPPTQQK